MSEAFDGSGVSVKPTPMHIKGVMAVPNITGDRCLSSVDFHFDFLDAPAPEGKSVAECRLELSDGTIGAEINELYTKLEAAATAAGHSPQIPDPDNEGKFLPNPEWPVRPDVQKIWDNAKKMMGATGNLDVVLVAQFITNKNWGQRMLKKEWAKINTSVD